MIIQKQLGKRVGNKVYPKYVIVIPKEKLLEAGFKEGDELNAEAKKEEIILKRKKAN